MTMRRGAVGALLVALAAGTALAEDPQPGRGPLPAWVHPMAIPDPDPAHAEDPLQILLIDGQSRLTPTSTETYFEMVMKPQNVAGLQGVSTVALPWQMDRSDLVIHAIERIRDGKHTDLIGQTQFMVIQSEDKLKQSMITGQRVVVLPVKGVDMGDLVRISATFKSKPSKIGDLEAGSAMMRAPFAVALLHSKIIAEPGVAFDYKVVGKGFEPTVTKAGGGTTIEIKRERVQPAEFPDNMLARDKVSAVYFTTEKGWEPIATRHGALYKAARVIKDGSPLAAEADKIAAASKDPLQRMMAALRLTQDRMRYVAVVLGEGAYQPTEANKAWEDRYGDCKAKSAVLLGLLDRLGIAAEPLYVSSDAKDKLADVLPSAEYFDHVIVRAHVDGKAYYLDGTDYGQRIPADVAGTKLGYGLPLVQGAKLELLPSYVAPKPIRETDLVWDARAGIGGKIPFTATLTLRGPNAVAARSEKMTADKPADFETYLKNFVHGIDNEDMKVGDVIDDPATGELRAKVTGAVDMGWDEGAKGKRLEYWFNNAVTSWDMDFDREKGDYKEAAVDLNDPYWEKATETILLPPGKAFTLDKAEPIDKTVAGAAIKRTVTVAPDRAVQVSEFRYVEPAIAAATARAAKTDIDAINDSWARLVAPKGMKVPKPDTKSDAKE